MKIGILGIFYKVEQGYHISYLGHGHVGEQPQFFEVTRDKKVVWQFDDHAHFKTINQIQLLDVPGDVSKGKIFR